jgi:predicted transcriptional regulator
MSEDGVECVASATQILAIMKTATFPSLRVDPELRDAAESVLQEGETLSSMIETSVREAIDRRRTRSEFMARGLAARDETRRTGVTFDADEVHAELAQKLAAARAKLQKKARP